MSALGIIDLFAGPGGWDTGLSMIGRNDVLGIEWDGRACETARAAGHARLQADIAQLDPMTVTLDHWGFDLEGLIASPPCQGFSLAGSGKGRQDTVAILEAVAEMGNGADPRAELAAQMKDSRSVLVLEPLRWVLETNPQWTTWEQVPAVLPLWEACAEVLREYGYNVAVGNVQAEQYGVPQTRKRAILVASRTQPVALPTPTHSKYYNRSPEKMDAGVKPWVSMAEALRWGLTQRPAYTVVAGGARSSFAGAEWGSNAVRKKLLALSESDSPEWHSKTLGWGMTHRPYPTIATGTEAGGTDPQALGGSRAREIVRREREEGRWIEKDYDDRPDRAKVTAIVEERVNNQSGTAFDLSWPVDRPAPTIAGREIVTMPGANANRFNGATKSRNDGIRVSVQEAGILQSFPEDYPWRGNRGQQYRQVGDAVPPLLAAHILAAAGVEQREPITEAVAA